jgi:ankyrin repeat protein
MGNNREEEARRRKAFLDSLNKRDLTQAEELLRSGTDIDAPLNDVGWTALHVAVENYFVDLALLLLEHGADPSRRDFSGVTPLHLAIDVEADSASQRAPIEHGKRNVPVRDMTVLLVEHGADCNARTEKGETPMDWAAKWRHQGAIDAMIAHGASPREE